MSALPAPRSNRRCKSSLADNTSHLRRRNYNQCCVRLDLFKLGPVSPWARFFLLVRIDIPSDETKLASPGRSTVLLSPLLRVWRVAAHVPRNSCV